MTREQLEAEVAASGCRCGHDESLHVERRGRLECTVCVCNAFDWEMPPENRTLTDESVNKMLSQIKPRHLLSDRHTGIVPLQALHSLLSEVRASRSAAKCTHGLSAEVARLREEIARQRSDARALVSKADELSGALNEGRAHACAGWDCAACGLARLASLANDVLDGIGLLAGNPPTASNKRADSEPAPPASEPTREALLAARSIEAVRGLLAFEPGRLALIMSRAEAALRKLFASGAPDEYIDPRYPIGSDLWAVLHEIEEWKRTAAKNANAAALLAAAKESR